MQRERATSFYTLLLLVFVALPVPAQQFPSKPITLIVPAGAGSQSDQLARMLAGPMSERLKQPVVVENKPGASGAVGTTIALQAAPDGYTLLLLSASVLNWLPTNAPADQLRTAELIEFIGRDPYVVVVSSNAPYKQINDLRSGTGKLTLGEVGGRSYAKINSSQLIVSLKISADIVPFKSDSELIAGLLDGRIAAAFLPYTSVAALSSSGKLRVLAHTGSDPHPKLQGVPTLTQAGLKGRYFDNWFAIVGPKGIPDGVAKTLSTAVASARATSTWNRLVESGLQPGVLAKKDFAVEVDIRLTQSIGDTGDPVCPSDQCYCRAKKECRSDCTSGC